MAAKEYTTSYTWNDGGVIQRIDVRQQKNGFAVAYLYADDREEERGQRNNIRAALRLKGWGTLSDSRDGKFVLRVTGLRSGDELVGLLREHGFVQGEPQTHSASDAGEQVTGLWNQMKSRTLRASGIFATLGNAMSIAEGFHRRSNPALTPKQKNDKIGQIGMGAAFAVADLPLVFVDEKDNSRQLNLLLKKLRNKYESNGIEIPENASIYVETSDKGKTFGERTQDFLHSYANQIKCGFEVVASFFAIKAGFEQRVLDPKVKEVFEKSGIGIKTVPWKSIAGLIFGPAFLASLLITEKKIDDEKYAQASPLGKLWMKIQSNPLSIGGLFGYSNTIATYLSAGREQKEQNVLKNAGMSHTKYHRWDYIIPTDMIAANGFYAMSKKNCWWRYQERGDGAGCLPYRGADY